MQDYAQHLAQRHLAIPLLGLVVAAVTCVAMDGADRALMLALPGIAVLAAFALPTLQRSGAAGTRLIQCASRHRVHGLKQAALRVRALAQVDAEEGGGSEARGESFRRRQRHGRARHRCGCHGQLPKVWEGGCDSDWLAAVVRKRKELCGPSRRKRDAMPRQRRH
jgi:hypothetical protein